MHVFILTLQPTVQSVGIANGTCPHKLSPGLPLATAAAAACSLLLHPSTPLRFAAASGRAQHIFIFE